MPDGIRPHGLLFSLRQILSHGIITVLAMAIAFSLPPVASYILYAWWPLVEKDPNLLLATEITVASLMVLLLNFVKIVWDSRHSVAIAKLTALAYARHDERNWVTCRRERALLRRVSAARDACILTLTGYSILVQDRNKLRGALESAYEIRVLLANPIGPGLRRRVESLPPEITLESYQKEIRTSITYLSELRKTGKKVTLKFYDGEPFWKVFVLGDHVLVQHFHAGLELRHQPEYVFTLQHDNPRAGLYIPFYTHFLEQWEQPGRPEFDFGTDELVYRDASGNECRRDALDMVSCCEASSEDTPPSPAKPATVAATHTQSPLRH